MNQGQAQVLPLTVQEVETIGLRLTHFRHERQYLRKQLANLQRDIRIARVVLDYALALRRGEPPLRAHLDAQLALLRSSETA